PVRLSVRRPAPLSSPVCRVGGDRARTPQRVAAHADVGTTAVAAQEPGGVRGCFFRGVEDSRGCSVRVSEAMTPTHYDVHPDPPLREALVRMRGDGVDVLPVVDGDEVVGL